MKKDRWWSGRGARGVAGVGLLAALAAPAMAQLPTPTPIPGGQPVIFLEELNVVATRSAKTLQDTPASVVVIDREQIDRYQMNDMEELIRYTPGVTVDRGFGADPFKQLNGFNIRGVGGNRVLTLIDGNRVAERITDGTRNFVDLSFMRAVEIVRGPSSILWGSDAMGGVVSYETLNPGDVLEPGQTWNVEGSFRYGTLDQSFNETLIGAARFGAVEMLLGYSRWDANELGLTNGKNEGGIWGDCPRDPAATNCDKLDPLDQGSNGFIGKVVWNADEANRVTLTGEYYTQTVDVEQDSLINSISAGTRTLSYEQEQDLTRWRASLEHEWAAENILFDALAWQVTYQPQSVDITGTRLRELASLDHQKFERVRDFDENFIDFEAQFDKTVVATEALTTHLTYGLDGSYTIGQYGATDTTTNLTTGTSTTAATAGFFYTDADTLRLDGYALAEIGLFDDRLIFSPGLRYSYTKITPYPQQEYVAQAGFDPETTTYNDLLFAASLLYKVTDNISVYAAYNEGFKTPTAQQLYTTVPGTTFAVVPNPDLKPESVRSYEMGARLAFERWAFSLTGFYSKYDDFIAGFQPAEGPDPAVSYLTSENISEVTIWGIEAGAEVEIVDNLILHSALSWQHGDQIPLEDADEIPWNSAQPLTIVTGIGYDDGYWGLELVHTYESGLRRVSSELDLTTENYSVFDIVGYWQPEPWVVLRAGVYNVTDQRYLPASAVAAYGTAKVPDAATAAGNPIEARIAPGINAIFTVSFKF